MQRFRGVMDWQVIFLTHTHAHCQFLIQFLKNPECCYWQLSGHDGQDHYSVSQHDSSLASSSLVECPDASVHAQRVLPHLREEMVEFLLCPNCFYTAYNTIPKQLTLTICMLPFEQISADMSILDAWQYIQLLWVFFSSLEGVTPVHLSTSFHCFSLLNMIIYSQSF